MNEPIKIFLSVPMKGKTKAEIDKTIDELKMDLVSNLSCYGTVEFINTIVTDNPPIDTNKRIWYLGQSISLLSKATLVAVPKNRTSNPGCEIEHQVAKLYGLDIIEYDLSNEEQQTLDKLRHESLLVDKHDKTSIDKFCKQLDEHSFTNEELEELIDEFNLFKHSNKNPVAFPVILLVNSKLKDGIPDTQNEKNSMGNALVKLMWLTCEH